MIKIFTFSFVIMLSQKEVILVSPNDVHLLFSWNLRPANFLSWKVLLKVTTLVAALSLSPTSYYGIDHINDASVYLVLHS